MFDPDSALYTAAEVRELDRIAIEGHGIPGIALMRRAGRAVFEAARALGAGPLTVYCGAGNNGGDGYVAAALAAAAGLPVRAVAVADPERLHGDARRAFEYAREEGVPTHPLGAVPPPAEGVVVDALLGTGLKGPPREPFAAAIREINGSGLAVVAVDVPSGLDADAGRPLGEVVRAAVTVTFIGRKRGLYTGAGPAVCGRVRFRDLGVPAAVRTALAPTARLARWRALSRHLPRRPRDAHKGLFGHVLVIGGDLGFGGAATLAAEAALRAGAGLVSVATRPEHVAAILARTPEAMVRGVESGQDLEPLLERPTVLVVGPGLGRSAWSEQLLQRALGRGLPMVLDADALNLLAAGRFGQGADLGRAVLTPHPGEAARLLGTSAAEVQADRFAAAEALAARFGATVLLKGAGTLVAGGGDSQVAVIPFGGPGLATGGTGDVLSGVVGALLAQGLQPRQAAELGAAVHGLAGERAAARWGEVGLRAGDLPGEIAHLLSGTLPVEEAE
ncbi:MAG: bifunctional NAD(P)H-hydrate repair enzyme [Porticoccaceae bacterium]|nr:MAG: bifunctional NAD(P)H-hydrate repair enzyme [Porticoccaceae bacterium]